MHSDNDTAFINDQLERYAHSEGIKFLRSRPYKKNDNCFVEQKNSTHIRAILGHLRYDTDQEQEIINSLYRGEFRLYKNFFQPVMKLKGKIHRRYDVPKTPYQRLMESDQISEETKKKLKEIYLSLNPAELKRRIDEKIHMLFEAYEEKNQRSEASPFKRQRPYISKEESYIFNDLKTSPLVT